MENIAPQSKPIIIERHFKQPLSTIWKAWNDEATFKKWWGPKDYTCPSCKIDFREGGSYLACMRSKEGKEFWSTGTIKEIIPHKLIYMTDSFADRNGNKINAREMGMPGEWPDELFITVHLIERNGKTEMIVTHQGIPYESYDDCVKGWNESLDKMEQL